MHINVKWGISDMAKHDTHSDTELLKGLARNLSGTFEQLVHTYDAQLRGFVQNKVRCEENTKDIMQNCWMRAFQALNQYPQEQILTLKLRPWLFTIARTTMCTYIEKGRKDMSNTTPIESFKDNSWEPACELSPEDIAEFKEQIELVKITINQLPLASRTVLTLYILDELKYDEIAKRLHQPVKNVRANGSRGLKQLRKMLAAHIY